MKRLTPFTPYILFVAGIVASTIGSILSSYIQTKINLATTEYHFQTLEDKVKLIQDTSNERMIDNNMKFDKIGSTVEKMNDKNNQQDNRISILEVRIK